MAVDRQTHTSVMHERKRPDDQRSNTPKVLCPHCNCFTAKGFTVIGPSDFWRVQGKLLCPQHSLFGTWHTSVSGCPTPFSEPFICTSPKIQTRIYRTWSIQYMVHATPMAKDDNNNALDCHRPPFPRLP